MSLKILINAYACAPNMGSEPGMGWNWCIHLAQYCELHIITEGEFKHQIDAALRLLPQAKNMHFYYNPVPQAVREMCWNQGDWRFYRHYQNWQKEVLGIARTIVELHHIDIVHQLNMVGFREPGYLWKIKDIPFVWGPIGGLKQFPVAYLNGADLKMQAFTRLKNAINILQIKFDRRVNLALKSASCLVSSIPDSYHAIKTHKGLESTIIPETGCYALNPGKQSERFQGKKLKVVWVGKFDFRKQLPLALKSLAESGNKNIELSIFGKGSVEQEQEALLLAISLGISDQVVWRGSQPNQVVLKAMQSADLFFFTSVSEDTSTVVLEAISCALPVLCFDACGFGAVINKKVGIKIPFTHPEQSVKDFAKKLNYLAVNRQELIEFSNNCLQRQHELSWDEKAKKMFELYQNCLTKQKPATESFAR